MTENMSVTPEQLTAIEEESWNPPPYGVSGRMLVQVLNLDPLEVEVHDYDSDTSVFWIGEGMGYDYWFELHLDEPFPSEGWFVFEQVVGYYIKGVSWRESPNPTDDDEEWEYGTMRPATESEIITQVLDTQL